MEDLLENPHPGIILLEEFLMPLGMSQTSLAKAIDVPANRISEIIRGRRGITAETDLLFSKFFGLSEGYWLRLQDSYEIMQAKRDEGCRKKLRKTKFYKEDSRFNVAHA